MAERWSVTMGKKRTTPKSFEEALGLVEKSVGRLEEGNLTLDECLTEYERGAKALKACYEYLEEAEKKFLILDKSLDGKLEAADSEEP